MNVPSPQISTRSTAAERPASARICSRQLQGMRREVVYREQLSLTVSRKAVPPRPRPAAAGRAGSHLGIASHGNASGAALRSTIDPTRSAPSCGGRQPRARQDRFPGGPSRRRRAPTANRSHPSPDGSRPGHSHRPARPGPQPGRPLDQIAPCARPLTPPRAQSSPPPCYRAAPASRSTARGPDLGARCTVDPVSRRSGHAEPAEPPGNQSYTNRPTPSACTADPPCNHSERRCANPKDRNVVPHRWPPGGSDHIGDMSPTPHPFRDRRSR